MGERIGAATIEPRGLRRQEAALYCGMAPTTFDARVDDGSLPKPIFPGRRPVWDRYALDNLLDGGAQNTGAEELALAAIREAGPQPLSTGGPRLRTIPAPDAGSAPGFVYFLQSERSGTIKIGFARDVRKRLRALQTANAEPLRLIGFIAGDFAAEQNTLRRFEKLKLRGEWFEAAEPLLGFIREHCRG